MQYLWGGLVALFLAVILAVGASYSLYKYCSLEHLLGDSSHITQPKGANDETKDADSSNDLRSPNVKPSPPASFELRVTAPNKIEGSYYAAERKGDEGNWVNKYVCEMKLEGLLVAVFTLFLVLVTGFLWVSTDLLRKATAEAHSVTIAGQRAYVSLLAPQADLVRDAEGHIVGLRVWAVWKNSGTTPAANVFTLVGATFTVDPNSFVFGQSDNAAIETPLAMGPGVEIQSGDITISPQHFLQTLGGRGAQFFWGRARYRDIFPGSPEHVVEFCYRVMVDGVLRPGTSDIRLGFTPFGDHNRYYDT